MKVSCTQQIGIDRALSCEWCFLHEEYEDGKLRYEDEMRHKTTYSVNSNRFIGKMCTDAVYLLANFRLNFRFEAVLYVKYVQMQFTSMGISD